MNIKQGFITALTKITNLNNAFHKWFTADANTDVTYGGIAIPSRAKFLSTVAKGDKGDTGTKGDKGDEGDTGAIAPDAVNYLKKDFSNISNADLKTKAISSGLASSDFIEQISSNIALLAFNHETQTGATMFDGMAVDEFDDNKGVYQAVSKNNYIALLNTDKNFGTRSSSWTTFDYLQNISIASIDYTIVKDSPVGDHSLPNRPSTVRIEVSTDNQNWTQLLNYTWNSYSGTRKESIKTSATFRSIRYLTTNTYGNSTSFSFVLNGNIAVPQIPISKAFTPKANFSKIQAVIKQEPITAGASFDFDVSIDNGTTWTTVTLVQVLDGAVNVLKAVAKVSGKKTSKIKWRIRGDAGEEQKNSRSSDNVGLTIMTKPTLSDALKEAYAHAPSDVFSIDTIDFIHPDLTAPLRIVSGLTDVHAKLESTAPKDAGQTVLFKGVPFTFKSPSQGISPTPEAVLEISNVGAGLSSILDDIMVSFVPVKIIYRAYTNKTLLLEPQLSPPPIFQMVSASGTGVLKISLRAIDLTKMRFPKELYDV